MKSIPLPILFALGTALCWGLYGPVLGKARSPVGDWTAFKPYVGIGLAYIVWAFIGGIIMMLVKGDSFSFSGRHSAALIWGFAAGSLGAFGALSLTSAMISFTGKPRPELVMPIVFGGAVSVMAVVSLIQSGEGLSSFTRRPLLWVGILGIAICAVIVAQNTPHGGPHKPKEESSDPDHVTPPTAATDQRTPHIES